MKQVGVVVIGRNVAKHLPGSLEHADVYVDSGSTDGSVALARQQGVAVVELDGSLPFTAARARNAGLKHCLQLAAGLELVQFVDGDCELVEGWLERAVEALQANPQVVAVWGRRRERWPARNIYHRICNVEWHVTPSLGGDVMMRVPALLAVGGYNESIISGEDAELSLRLEQAGGRLLRIDSAMTIHDVAMDRFVQWWQRTRRMGYGYGQVCGVSLLYAGQIRRTLAWVALTIGAPLLARATHNVSLAALLAYPLRVIVVALRARRHGMSWADGLAWGIASALSVFPAFSGLVSYHYTRWRQRKHRIIEYSR